MGSEVSYPSGVSQININPNGEVKIKFNDENINKSKWTIITSVALIAVGFVGLIAGFMMSHALIFVSGILLGAIGGSLVLPDSTKTFLSTASKAVTLSAALIGLASIVL